MHYRLQHSLFLLVVVLSVSVQGHISKRSASTGSCHNYTGCCNPEQFINCFGDPVTNDKCYCDQICYEFNDCCDDIASAGCLAASNEPTEDTGSCSAMGYNGCCNENTHKTCKGDDNICWCSQVCFEYGDCCSDIYEIGCFEHASSPIATPTEGSCVTAGFEDCCNPGNSPNCYGNPPTCYCDAECIEFNDCCSDFTQICKVTVESPTLDHGSCAGLGFDGCCEPTVDENCHGTDGVCYCDKVCYNFGDCCNDVEEIQCFNDNPTDGSCVAMGYVGCCNPQDSSSCLGSGNTCYCDELCYEFNDCCDDVTQIGCIAPTASPVVDKGSCLLAGHSTCCVIADDETCLGSDGICYCDAQCYDIGDCCIDIAILNCVTSSPPSGGSCKDAGYESCCHPSDQAGATCFGDPNVCYCDQVCFSFGDCCDDVTDIGCIQPSVIPSAPNGSCVAAGYKSCCVQTDDDSCHGHPETCFCDASCHNFGDCCADINDIGCSSMQGSCLAAGHTSCCLSEDPKCTGEPGNCMCDQACAKRGDCCSDISSLTNCEVHDVSGPVQNLMVIGLSNTTLYITWDEPLDTNGANAYAIHVINYTKTSNDIPFLHVISINAKREQNVNGLKPYTPYNVTVYALNENGNGEMTTKTNFTVEGVPNVAPSGITVSRYSSNTLKVTWNGLNLTEARGFIDSYKISYSTLSRRRSSTNGFITVPGDQTSASIPDVDSNKKYGVTVAAQTKKGTGPDSIKVSESGKSKAPNIPLIIGVIVAIVGFLLFVIAIVFVIVLIMRKMKGKGSGVSGRNYKMLLVQANEDYDDDDDDDD